METVTVNRKVLMVLGGIAGAAALVVFFAGFLVAIGLLGPSPAPVPAGPSGAGGLAKGVTQIAPGLAKMQKDLPGGAKLQVKTETGDVSITKAPGVGQVNIPGAAPATPAPATPAPAAVPPPAAPAAPAASAPLPARAPPGQPGASVALPSSPPPVAGDDSAAPPPPSPLPPRAALPGAVPPRAAAPAAPRNPPAAAARGADPAANPPAANPPAAASRSAGAGAGGAGAPLRILPPTPPPAAGAGVPAPAGGAAAGAGGAPGFAIQVGAFLTGAHATRLAEDLQKRGHDARVVVETDTSGRSWHIVRVGRFSDRYAALGAANRLKSAEGVPTMVVTELATGPALR